MSGRRSNRKVVRPSREPGRRYCRYPAMKAAVATCRRFTNGGALSLAQSLHLKVMTRPPRTVDSLTVTAKTLEKASEQTSQIHEPYEMVEQGKPGAATVAKPAAKATGNSKGKGQDRRFFLFTWIGLAWTTFTLTMVGWVLGTLRFLFPNVLSEPPSTFTADPVTSYEENVVTDKYKDKGVWIVRSREGDPEGQGRDVIYALSTVCTHLGCTPNWLDGEKKFKCPCHGSGFKISGVNFEGPAPRPLERYAIRQTDDGLVFVDKSRKFQQERGEWTDPNSYILL